MKILKKYRKYSAKLSSRLRNDYEEFPGKILKKTLRKLWKNFKKY